MGTTSNAIFTGSSQFSTDFQNSITRAVNLASMPITQLKSDVTKLQSQSDALSGIDAKFAALQSAGETGTSTVLDTYGATNPAEFFAVVTEAFFERPRALRGRHPELYAQLARFFRQDPSRYSAEATTTP